MHVSAFLWMIGDNLSFWVWGTETRAETGLRRKEGIGTKVHLPELETFRALVRALVLHRNPADEPQVQLTWSSVRELSESGVVQEHVLQVFEHQLVEVVRYSTGVYGSGRSQVVEAHPVDSKLETTLDSFELVLSTTWIEIDLRNSKFETNFGFRSVSACEVDTSYPPPSTWFWSRGVYEACELRPVSSHHVRSWPGGVLFEVYQVISQVAAWRK